MRIFAVKINLFRILGSIVAAGILIYILIFVIGISANQSGSFYNKGNNAVWLGHEWVGERKQYDEIEDLIKHLKENQIDTVFLHSGPLNADGKVDTSTYKYALYFIEKAKQLDKNIEYQAWLGQIRSKIDLSDPEVRHNVAKQAFILTDLVGFDGVHLDIEPIWDGDIDFIELLKETRELISEDKLISVALAEFIPRSFIWMVEKIHQFENFNSETNYLNVAKYADQLVVMAYDTGINQSWLYRWLVKEQTIWLTALLEGKKVFIGIPAYDEVKEGFNPQVENVENGLKGIIDGLNNIRSSEENFAGVAIYSYWEMDDKEWEAYQNLWIK